MKKPAAKKRVVKPKVKRIKLTPDSVVTVAVPKGLVPVVATDPVNRVVSIIPSCRAPMLVAGAPGLGNLD